MRCRAFAAAAVTAGFVMMAGHLSTLLHAQSASAASGIPKLTGYWNGGLIGRPRPSGGGRGGGRGGSAEGGEGDLVKLINARAKAVIAAFDEYAPRSTTAWAPRCRAS